MGHFGEIRLADPVFSAVVLPSQPGSGMLNFLKPVGLSAKSRFLSQQVCIYFLHH